MVDGIIKGLEELRGWVESRAGRRELARQHRAQTLRAVITALNETGRYLSDLQSGKPDNEETEKRLSGLWSEAVVLIHEYDSDLAELWFLKSRAWADPRLWDDPRFQDPRLSLPSITRQCKRLMRGGLK